MSVITPQSKPNIPPSAANNTTSPKEVTGLELSDKDIEIPGKTKKMSRFHRTLSVVKRGLSSRAPSPASSASSSTQSSPVITASSSSSNTTKLDQAIKGPNSRFVFQLAEAFAPKPRDSRQTNYSNVSRYRQSADDEEPRPNSGEDAFFKTQVTKGNKIGNLAFGVADGVGGWGDIGVDPSLYSYRLCRNMRDRFKELEIYEDRQETPLSVLEHAYKEIIDHKQVEAGSSTACVGVISPDDGKLQVANLGDSGYSIFRQGRLYRQSKPQTHIFNTPYQMAILPESLKLNQSQRIDDKPADAELSDHELKHGDVVVFSTDGLTDNMFAHEALQVVTDLMTRSNSWVRTEKDSVEPGEVMTGAEELATALVKYATAYSLDAQRNSPFSQELRRLLKLDGDIYGGKPDDVTVLVLLVQGISPATNSPSMSFSSDKTLVNE